MMRQAKTRPSASAAIAAVLLASVACGDDTDDGGARATTPTVPTTVVTAATGTTAAASGRSGRLIEVVVRGGSVQGGGRHEVSLDEEVRLRVTSDAAEEVHVHGYERRVDVAAGQTAEVSFVANLPGVFEVELEKSGRRLLDLEVQP